MVEHNSSRIDKTPSQFGEYIEKWLTGMGSRARESSPQLNRREHRESDEYRISHGYKNDHQAAKVSRTEGQTLLYVPKLHDQVENADELGRKKTRKGSDNLYPPPYTHVSKRAQFASHTSVDGQPLHATPALHYQRLVGDLDNNKPAKETSSCNESTSNKYARRKRHKTKPDKYEFKGNDPKRNSKSMKKARTKVNRQRGGATVHKESIAPNIESNRLTLEPAVRRGLFSKSKFSTAGEYCDLPDLNFPNMTLLSQQNCHEFRDLLDAKSKQVTKRSTGQAIVNYFSDHPEHGSDKSDETPLTRNGLIQSKFRSNLHQSHDSLSLPVHTHMPSLCYQAVDTDINYLKGVQPANQASCTYCYPQFCNSKNMCAVSALNMPQSSSCERNAAQLLPTLSMLAPKYDSMGSNKGAPVQQSCWLEFFDSYTRRALMGNEPGRWRGTHRIGDGDTIQPLEDLKLLTQKFDADECQRPQSISKTHAATEIFHRMHLADLEKGISKPFSYLSEHVTGGDSFQDHTVGHEVHGIGVRRCNEFHSMTNEQERLGFPRHSSLLSNTNAQLVTADQMADSRYCWDIGRPPQNLDRSIKPVLVDFYPSTSRLASVASQAHGVQMSEFNDYSLELNSSAALGFPDHLLLSDRTSCEDKTKVCKEANRASADTQETPLVHPCDDSASIASNGQLVSTDTLRDVLFTKVEGIDCDRCSASGVDDQLSSNLVNDIHDQQQFLGFSRPYLLF